MIARYKRGDNLIDRKGVQWTIIKAPDTFNIIGGPSGSEPFYIMRTFGTPRDDKRFHLAQSVVEGTFFYGPKTADDLRMGPNVNL